MATSGTTSAIPRAAAAYEDIAGIAALLTGLAGFLYAVAFIVLKNAGLSALFLLVGGLLSTAVLVALYGRLRRIDEPMALLGLILSLAGAFGAAIHGGYDLSNALHPPASTPDLPSGIDPRGLLTFGVAGLGLCVFAWLIGRDRRFPAGLSLVGYLAALLLIVLYLVRLIVLDAKSPIVAGPALLDGFVVNPAWYLWLGLTLLGHWRMPRREGKGDRQP